MEVACFDDLAVAHGKHGDLAAWDAAAGVDDQHVNEQREVISGDEWSATQRSSMP